MGLRSVNIRLGKQERPAPAGRKRGRPEYEVLNGAALCEAWPTPGTVLARWARRRAAVAAVETDHRAAG